MSTGTLISIGEYLSTDYSPDRDYVDGEVLERNMGEFDHNKLQKLLLFYLAQQYETKFGFVVIQEQRVQVSPTRFRIPDLCVLPGEPHEQIITKPPLICIEILSPEDRMSRMQEKIEDYLRFGVNDVWILDPWRKKAFWADSSGVHEAVDGMLSNHDKKIRIELSSFWPVE